MQFSWVVCFASQGILSLFNFCKKHLGYWQFLRIATALALINKLHHINGFFQFVFPPSSTGEAVELQLHLVSPKHRQHDTLSVMPTDRCLISLLVFLLLMLATSAPGQGRRLEVIPLSVSAAWDGFSWHGGHVSSHCATLIFLPFIWKYSIYSSPWRAFAFQWTIRYFFFFRTIYMLLSAKTITVFEISATFVCAGCWKMCWLAIVILTFYLSHMCHRNYVATFYKHCNVVSWLIYFI